MRYHETVGRDPSRTYFNDNIPQRRFCTTFCIFAGGQDGLSAWFGRLNKSPKNLREKHGTAQGMNLVKESQRDNGADTGKSWRSYGDKLVTGKGTKQICLRKTESQHTQELWFYHGLSTSISRVTVNRPHYGHFVNMSIGAVNAPPLWSINSALSADQVLLIGDSARVEDAMLMHGALLALGNAP